MKKRWVKRIGALGTAIGLLVNASPLWAAPPPFANADLSTPGTSRTLVLPPAADNADVIDLGDGVDPQTGKVVQGLAFIDYKKGFSHKPQHPNNNGGAGNSCYAYLASGAKWKTEEPWVVNPDNTEGLGGEFVFNNLTASIDEWEDAADGVLGNGVRVGILGGGVTTSGLLVADTDSPDGQNEVYFGDITNQGAIAVTIVWGVFSGPPWGRELVEWDQVYDQVDFDWSDSGEAGKMDFENINEHELGHSTGMGHPDDSCTEETMYRYADYGETKKRDLNSGDIAGINNLY